MIAGGCILTDMAAFLASSQTWPPSLKRLHKNLATL
jgi:hypothetical protein